MKQGKTIPSTYFKRKSFKFSLFSFILNAYIEIMVEVGLINPSVMTAIKPTGEVKLNYYSLPLCAHC